MLVLQIPKQKYSAIYVAMSTNIYKTTTPSYNDRNPNEYELHILHSKQPHTFSSFALSSCSAL